ncbi:MAG: serine O-acetyltransferase [Microcystaceae cyanobacterium]
MNLNQQVIPITHPLIRVKTFVKLLKTSVRAIEADLKAIAQKDPAAGSYKETLTCYPGFHALIIYRISHLLYHLGWIWVARFLSYLCRCWTGIEIHPAAQLGQGILIDHGMGVVIGATAIVGDGVTLYQGVTLGGTGKQQGKRHPTLGDNVIVGAGAKVLGNIEIGNNTRIGAGSVTLQSIPNNATAVGIPARVVCQNGQRVGTTEYCFSCDATGKVINRLTERIEILESELHYQLEYVRGSVRHNKTLEKAID